MDQRGGGDASRPSGRSVGDRILESYDGLSKGERRIADILLESPADLQTHSAGDLACRAGVSNATVARLFKKLGFSSFRQARAQDRDHGPAQPQSTQSLVDNLVRLAGHDVTLSGHLANDMQNLIRSIESLRSDALAQAIRVLANAEKIWVVGFGDNYALLHLSRSLLIRIKPDIRMIPIGGFSVPEEFASINPGDAMLGLGLRGGSRALAKIMASARDAGATTILMTDQIDGGLSRTADVTLRCRTRGSALFDSLVAPVSVITYICAAVALSIGEPAIERLHRIESIHDAWADRHSDADPS